MSPPAWPGPAFLGAILLAACASGPAVAPDASSAGAPSVGARAAPEPATPVASGPTLPRAVAAEPTPPAPPSTLFVGPRDPSGSHPELLAIDATTQRAFVRSIDARGRVTIDTVDLAAGAVADRWQNDAAHPVQSFGFARLAFSAFSRDRAADLRRWASIALHAEERALGVPSVAVSRGAARIAYLVAAPPKLQVAVARGDGTGELRIGTPRMRGNDPSLSPDGRWLAFAACAPDATSNDCAEALWIADLEGDAAPRRLPVAWPSRVAWDDDARGLWTTQAIALARATMHTEERRSCLLHVDVAEGLVAEVACADDAYDVSFGLAPDRRSAVLVTRRGEPPGGSFTLRSCDTAARRCEPERPIPLLVGPPLLTNDGLVVSAGYRGLPWAVELRSGQHGTLDGGGWYGRAIRRDATHGFAWIELRSDGQGGPTPTYTYAIRGLDAADVSRAGPPPPR